nr:hypothetical protein [Candidatus Thiosymbion oneisti]
MKAVLEGNHPAGLRVVHTARMDDRHAFQAAGDAAHHIGADTPVQVHQIRSAAPEATA